MPHKRTRAVTRIEVVTVAAVLMPLVVFVLPVLGQARQQAMMTRCAQILHGYGMALHVYASANEDYFPGINTSGVAVRRIDETREFLNRDDTPVQSWDWQSPLKRILDPGFSGTRAQRWFALWNEDRCPANNAVNEAVIGLPIDRDDFDALGPFPAISYVSIAGFQLWGDSVPLVEDDPRFVNSLTAGTTVVSRPIAFRSRLRDVGPADRKVFAADGAVFLDRGRLGFDARIAPGFRFSAFSDVGPWESYSSAYGVRSDSLDWSDRRVRDGNVSDGQSLPLTYRAGLHTGAPQPGPLSDSGASAGPGVTASPLEPTEPDGSVRSNAGTINALFFDGSVRLFADRASREIEYWYPTGSTVEATRVGLVAVPNGTVIP